MGLLVLGLRAGSPLSSLKTRSRWLHVAGISLCRTLFCQRKRHPFFPFLNPPEHVLLSFLGGGLRKTPKEVPNCRFILRFLGFLGHSLCSSTTRYSEESSSSRSSLLQGKIPEGVERAGVLESARPGFENQL